MKCSDCLIWERRLRELLYEQRVTIDYCCARGWDEEAGETVGYYRNELWGHAQFQDSEHRTCCLLFKGAINPLDKQVKK